MKKRFLIVFMLMIVLFNSAFALTLADLDVEEKILVEDAVLAEDTEITPATFESFEGIKFDIIYKGAGYVIIKLGTKLVVVYRHEV